jgi:hypothetical protein
MSYSEYYTEIAPPDESMRYAVRLQLVQDVGNELSERQLTRLVDILSTNISRKYEEYSDAINIFGVLASYYNINLIRDQTYIELEQRIRDRERDRILEHRGDLFAQLMEDVKTPMTKDAVSKLVTTTFGKYKKPFELISELEKTEKTKKIFVDKCTICICDFEDEDVITLLPCDHVFHEECIMPWLQKESHKCPICRTVCGTHAPTT